MNMKKINLKAAIVAVLGIVILAGCASAVHIEKDDTVNFNKYKTFTWLHGDEGKLKNQSDLAETKIRNAVSKEFEKIGWNRRQKDQLARRAAKVSEFLWTYSTIYI